MQRASHPSPAEPGATSLETTMVTEWSLAEPLQLAVWSYLPATDQLLWSPSLGHLLQRESPRCSSLATLLDGLEPDAARRLASALELCARAGQEFDLGVQLRIGDERRELRALGRRLSRPGSAAREIHGAFQDITALVRDRRRQQRQRQHLLAIAAGQPLQATLEAMVSEYETEHPGALGSILLLDDLGERVRHGAGAQLPAAYRAAIDGSLIGPRAGSCGTAAFRRERVIVGDIDSDPLWADYRDLALAHQLHACWSTPVLSSQGRVIATFAVYYRQPRLPSADEVTELDATSALVALAVEQSGLLENVRQVLESDTEVICVLDDQARFLQINAAARRLWQREPIELIGAGIDVVVHPEDLERAQAQAAQVIAGHAVVDFQCRMVAKDGRTVDMLWSASWSAQNRRIYAFGRDVTEHRRFERELAVALSHDPVTRLPRYTTLESLYAPLLSREPRSDERPLWLFFIDLDRFHGINETMGEGVGNGALQIIAERLQSALQGRGQLARFAGDEFVAVVPNLSEVQVRQQAEALRHAVAETLRVDEFELFVTASIGLARYPEHGRSMGELLRRAEGAMGQAKREGRDAVCVYSSAGMQEFEDRLALGGRLRQAVRDDELELHYQPQVRASDGRISGFEALVRWTRSPLGPVPPNRFIPIAEALGLMPDLGQWVLRQACRQARIWVKAGHPALCMAVNVSAQQLLRPNFLARVREALRESGLAPGNLQIELTESSLMENVDRVRQTLDGLRALGISLALDDFGTGYSSLAYLKRFAFDKLKIDRSFVADLTVDANDAAIARTIIAIGHQLRMSVAAEGVETAEQCGYLRTMGCDELQGYLLSRPVAADDASVLLAAGPLRLPE